MPTRSDRYSNVSGPVAHELSALPLRFLLEQSVLASRGALPLFTELPRRSVLGNRTSGITLSRKLRGVRRGPVHLRPGNTFPPFDGGLYIPLEGTFFSGRNEGLEQRP